MLTLPSILQIATSREDLHAFRITAEVSREDMTAMAEYMNTVFDRPGKVDMLMIFDRYEGAETGASLSWEALKSRFKSISNVNRYVVVGAPQRAQNLIEVMDNLLPVKAETFDEELAAWRSLNAEATGA
ncbi:DUF3478 domain containing protein [Sulfitobacter noctilucicola]|nr:DUF3478 domain containing protein [Sulfitobacter noctilucicola]